MVRKTNTQSRLYRGPVWITLNSFIWNIKTMKRKPSTKSDSYKCRIIRLFRMNRLHWKTSFFSLWMVKQIHRTDSEMWTWLCHLHAPNPTWQQNKRKTKNEEKKLKKKKKKKTSQENGTVIFVCLQLSRPEAVAAAPGFNRALVIGQNK